MCSLLLLCYWRWFNFAGLYVVGALVGIIVINVVLVAVVVVVNIVLYSFCLGGFIIVIR